MAARRGPGRGEARPSDGLGVRPKGRAATGPNDLLKASPIEHAAWHEPASGLPPVGNEGRPKAALEERLSPPWSAGRSRPGRPSAGPGSRAARAGRRGGQLGLEFLDVGDEGEAGGVGEGRGGARHRRGFLRRSGPSLCDATPQTGGGSARTRRAGTQRRTGRTGDFVPRGMARSARGKSPGRTVAGGDAVCSLVAIVLGRSVAVATSLPRFTAGSAWSR